MPFTLVTPKKVVRAFQLSIRTMGGQHDTLVAGIPRPANRTTLEGALAEQFALALGVRWEGFVHDLFVSYLLQNKRSFMSARKASIKQSVSDKFGIPWGKSVRIKTFRNWTPRIVEGLLDPRERNIVVTSADRLYERATELLGSKAIKFSLVPDDRALVDLVFALRNYLAHRSKASLKELNTIVGRFNNRGPNSGLSGRITMVDSYLRKRVGRRTQRIKLVYSRLHDISGVLA